MPHPVTEILRQLTDPSATGDSSAALDAFKREVWHHPFSVAGSNQMADNGGVMITMNLADPVNGTNKIMRICADKEQAGGEFGGDEFFSLPFRVILIFAESERMDAYLFDGDDSLLITHDQLLSLRDQVAMGGAGIPMSEQEVLQQRACTTLLATRARAYCSAQPDVESLHLSIIMMPGVKTMVAASLKAERMQVHVDALNAMSVELLQPRWRFTMYEADGEPESIGSMLKNHQPCYSRERDSGLWSKFKNTFTSPVVGILQVQMDPDPTAMALSESNVPEWCAQYSAEPA